MSATEAPIYVVLANDDLSPSYRAEALARDPNRKPNPIVFETEVERATLENARARCASLESSYGACRIARLVFEDVDGRPL